MTGRGPRSVTLTDLGFILYPGTSNDEELTAAIGGETNATSRNIYMTVKKILEGVGYDDVLLIFRNPGDVVEWIESLENADATKSMMFSCLCSLANPEKYTQIRSPKRSRTVFLKGMSKWSKLVRDVSSKNRLNDNERISMLPWPEIQKCYAREKHRLTDCQSVIAALYLAGGDNISGAPRRLDYNAVRVLNSFPKENEGNYIVVNGKKVTLVLNEFKTYNRYGRFVTRLPASTSKVITDSLTSRPREWLVYGSDGGPLTPSQLGERVCGVTKKLTGTRIGASNLRKSFITWLYSRDDITDEKLKKYAISMNHSPAEQKLYRRKNIQSTCRNKTGGRAGQYNKTGLC